VRHAPCALVLPLLLPVLTPAAAGEGAPAPQPCPCGRTDTPQIYLDIAAGHLDNHQWQSLELAATEAVKHSGAFLAVTRGDLAQITGVDREATVDLFAAMRITLSATITLTPKAGKRADLDVMLHGFGPHRPPLAFLGRNLPGRDALPTLTRELTRLLALARQDSRRTRALLAVESDDRNNDKTLAWLERDITQAAASPLLTKTDIQRLLGSQDARELDHCPLTTCLAPLAASFGATDILRATVRHHQGGRRVELHYLSQGVHLTGFAGPFALHDHLTPDLAAAVHTLTGEGR